MSNPVTAQRGGAPRPFGGYQPNMIAEPHSPATPWQMHQTIKQEPLDEDRNDSGVTSGGSDLQTSPSGSENSQELNPQKFPSTINNTYQNNISSYSSTPIMPRNAAPFNSDTINMSSPKRLCTNPQQTFQHARNEDMNTTPVASPTNSYKENCGEDRPETVDPLKRLQMSLEKNGLLSALSPKSNENSIDAESKSEIEFDEFDEQGLRIPKVNSHGKVKTYKCKQCEFIAITKLDFWEHSKVHIKSEKLLTCPRCPFGTEYKHHLEYHIRNHFGSKPFKCNQCAYSCVNKSMLNSHMKSHSNVYQYRCSDCTYATKYCHSLKLHLRKYDHQPAMVLNPDGTPNPLPIIDVYGTRRGPKQKSAHTPKSPQPEERQQGPAQALQNSLTQFMLNPQLPLSFAYPFLGGFPAGIPNPLLFQQNLVQMARNGFVNEPQKDADDPNLIAPTSDANQSDVLDLSKQENGVMGAGTEQQAPNKNRRKGIAVRLDLNKAGGEDEGDDDNDDGESECDEETEANNNDDNSNDGSEDNNTRDSLNGDKMETDETQAPEEVTNNNKPNNYSCQYCCISFGDVIMYTMHMGYHGYQEPFTCNMCGERCNDKVSFFLHIARTSHS
ncbi:Zinc finger, C2H2 type [Popillia japonica]|uniref:Protein hunchback n=1 Tax=Popillia japonica TaxID=7064 RepID=A0AAW1IBH7_POPJA